MNFKKLLAKMSKRGMATGPVMAFGGTVLALFLIVVITYVVTIAGAEINASTTNGQAQNVIGNGQDGIIAFSGLFSPIFVIVGISLLLVVLLAGVGAFLFNRR